MCVLCGYLVVIHDWGLHRQIASVLPMNLHCTARAAPQQCKRGKIRVCVCTCMCTVCVSFCRLSSTCFVCITERGFVFVCVLAFVCVNAHAYIINHSTSKASLHVRSGSEDRSIFMDILLPAPRRGVAAHALHTYSVYMNV